MLVKEQGLGFWHTLLAGFYGAIGCTIGGLLAYAFGRFGGRAFLERYGKWVLVSQKDLETADRWFAKYGDLAVFLSRMVPLVRTVMSIPAGIVHMPVARFTFFTFAGSLPWCWALAIAGYYFGEHYEGIREVTRPFAVAILAAIVLLTAFYVYRHMRSFRVNA
jgi:membrane protein DedA with SNARE-associated domain